MYINQEILFFPILSQIKPEILFSLSSHTFNWSQRLPRFPTFASHSLLSPRSHSSLQQSHQTFGDIQLVLSTIMTTIDVFNFTKRNSRRTLEQYQELLRFLEDDQTNIPKKPYAQGTQRKLNLREKGFKACCETLSIPARYETHQVLAYLQSLSDSSNSHSSVRTAFIQLQILSNTQYNKKCSICNTDNVNKWLALMESAGIQKEASSQW